MSRRPTPDPNTAKRDAVKAAWQRMQGDDARGNGAGGQKASQLRTGVLLWLRR